MEDRHIKTRNKIGSASNVSIPSALLAIEGYRSGWDRLYHLLYSLLAITFLNCTCLAQIPVGYYDSAQGLSGDALRTALFTIIDGHAEQTYASLWTHIQSTDNDSGKVWDMYSDIPSAAPNYTFTFGTDQCGNYAAEGDCYNREHSVPQSWFGSATPMHSDLFHVYPTDGYVNGLRSNYPYGETSNATKTTSNGSMVGPCDYPGYSGTIFEPIDAFKGDFARSYFYMMTRYKDNVSNWNSAMFTVDNLSTWANNLLLTWNTLDPVDQKEIDRNDAVYAIQGNRNPFIDNPSFVDSIWVQFVSTPTLQPSNFRMWVNDGTLHIQSDEPAGGSLEIINILGVVIQRHNLPFGNSSLPLPESKGLYLARVRGNGEMRTLKVLR